MAKDESSDVRTDEDSGYAAGSGRVVGHERVVTWAEETRRYRRPPGGWWWLALLAIPLLLAALGTLAGGDDSDTLPTGTSTTSVTGTRSATTSSSTSDSSDTASVTSESSGTSASASTSGSSTPDGTTQAAAAGCADLNDQVGAALAGTRISFGRYGSELTDDSVAVLERIAGLLGPCGDAKVTVTGYTDDSGGEAENQRISEDRAKAVRQVLLDNDVAAGQVQAVGKGESEQIPGGTSANRRVEITVK